MATINGVVKTMIQGKTGSLNRSSGYEYRDFWYTNASGQRVHVVGWHKALDITTLGTVVAFEKGKVISVQKGITGQTTNPSGGNSVTLEHANGDRTLYCHLDNNSNNHISVGQIVEAGAKLGTDTIKTTGNSTGLHLHFGIYIKSKGDYVDPTPYLQGKSVLKPYGGTPAPTPTPSSKLAVGTKVKLVAGASLYISSDATKATGSAKAKETVITRNNGSKHYYNTTGDYGWMDASGFTVITGGSTPTPQPSTKTHIVQRGENLSYIAKKYHTTWQKIYNDNKSVIGSNPNLIRVGQKLVIK